MSVDVAGAQHFREEIVNRALGLVCAVVDHHGNVGDLTSLNGLLVGLPFRAGVVGAFDAHHHALVLQRHLGRRLRFHVGQVVFVLRAAHAGADDIQERKDARLGPVDDAILEVLEITPAGAARVGDRCYAAAEREAVGRHAVVTGVGAALTAPVVDVDVDIDEAWRHYQSRNIHGL